MTWLKLETAASSLFTVLIKEHFMCQMMIATTTATIIIIIIIMMMMMIMTMIIMFNASKYDQK